MAGAQEVVDIPVAAEAGTLDPQVDIAVDTAADTVVSAKKSITFQTLQAHAIVYLHQNMICSCSMQNADVYSSSILDYSYSCILQCIHFSYFLYDFSTFTF